MEVTEAVLAVHIHQVLLVEQDQEAMAELVTVLQADQVEVLEVTEIQAVLAVLV